jgi:hypothetical protein
MTVITRFIVVRNGVELDCVFLGSFGILSVTRLNYNNHFVPAPPLSFQMPSWKEPINLLKERG